MTVVDHPEMTAAEARGDLTERLVPVAAELAFVVRTEDRETIGAWMDARGIPADLETRALLVVVASMVDIGKTPDELLGHVTWDEHGRPLEGMTPVLPIFSAPEEPLTDCGSYRGYQYHLRNGQRDRAALEACGCAQAARGKWAAQKQARRDGTSGRKAAEAGRRRAGQVERYAELRAGGMTIGAAAGEIGVDRRTAARWERKLKDEGRAPWREAPRAA